MFDGFCAPALLDFTSSLSITEIMYDPSTTEPLGEWVEIYNTSPSPVDISGKRPSDLPGQPGVPFWAV